MKSSTTDKVEGTAHQAKGAVKEKVGHIVKDEKMETEGAAENAAGKVQKKVGDVKKVAGK